jgi:hypothetical protein
MGMMFPGTLTHQERREAAPAALGAQSLSTALASRHDTIVIEGIATLEEEGAGFAESRQTIPAVLAVKRVQRAFADMWGPKLCGGKSAKGFQRRKRLTPTQHIFCSLLRDLAIGSGRVGWRAFT